MELKGYQNSVLDDLDEYLGALDRTGGIHAAWKDYWGHKGVAVNSGESQGVPGYFDDLAGVPNVCIKVPTGGGKTFLAACAVKHLFNRLPVGKTKLVAWLVPSDAILTQTVAHLSDPSHPYRQRLDRDFGGRVNVYTKEQLLNGQNFKPGDVAENLSVCVFCYASVRTSQIKKDDRKIYQENGNLLAFAETFKEKDALLAGTPETALLQVIRTMNPVVVVDESHNATSALSLEMLRNLNPSFVLAMTATPTERANVLSYVNARELKRENMVKLPVIVYNRPDRASVIRDAVRLRELLEAKAKEERKAGGSYIRPITLFQAQPRTSDDSETFDKIKAKLVGAGIPEKQIAIKTAQKDELGDTNLLLESCPIRYIVTVNALKEGWDCPFAYVLASLANKTSRTDVEQIVGRILRQPFARNHTDKLLNMSYVLSCSADFQGTIRSVVDGLNGAGFSASDYRVATPADEPPPPPEQLSLPTAGEGGNAANAGQGGYASTESESETEDDLSDIPDSLVPTNAEGGEDAATGGSGTTPLGGLVESAMEQGRAYDEATAQTEGGEGLESGVPNMKKYAVNREFAEFVRTRKIPQFAIREKANLFEAAGEETFVPLSEEDLLDGFSLEAQDATVAFNTSLVGVAQVDISQSGDVTPKSKYLSQSQLEFFTKQLGGKSDDEKLRHMAGPVVNLLDGSIDFCTKKELSGYVARVMAALPPATKQNLSPDMLVSFAECIRDKIKRLAREYGKSKFKTMFDINEITCIDTYALPPWIEPSPALTYIDKTLYEAEWNDLNTHETEVIQKIAAKGNVKWWHRIRERKGFCINAWKNHYPDFMVMTERGTLVIVEVKGPQLDGTDSQEKCEMGKLWATHAGPNYKYFMVFLKDGDGVPDGIKIDDFLNALERL